MWTEANRWERHGSAYRLANPATEQWAGRVTGMFLLQHAAPSHLRLGVGQVFRMVEQSQANQLAVPVMCPTALLFRRRLFVSRHPVSGVRQLAATRLVASLRVHVT